MSIAPRQNEIKLPRHLPGLDGVRGLAILMVMAVHFVGEATPGNAAEQAVVRLANYGVVGVDLFFVLSGFLITGLLVDAKGSDHYFLNFYARRTLRIFPLYYLALALLLVVLPRAMALPERLEEARQHQAWLWTYTTNIYLAVKGTWALTYVSHFWSLAVEEHFYLVWPLVVFSLSTRALERACVAIICATLAFRVGLSVAGVNLIALQVLTPLRIDALCFGGLLAILARREGGLESLLRRAVPAAVCLSAVVFALSAWGAVTGMGLPVLRPVRVTVLAFLAGAVTLISLKQDGNIVARAFQGRVLRIFGRYSYGLYVYHGIISYYMVDAGAEHKLGAMLGSHSLGIAAQAGLGVGISLLVSAVSYECFEKRVLALKRYFGSPSPEVAIARAAATKATVAL
jgi:peptidoglycan/LPS O-acetylase OafA/YrhL